VHLSHASEAAAGTRDNMSKLLVDNIDFLGSERILSKAAF